MGSLPRVPGSQWKGASMGACVRAWKAKGEAGSGSFAGATCDPAVPLKEPFSDEGVISAPLKSDGGAESDNDVNEDLLLCRMLEGAGPVALEVCLVN